MKELVFEPEVSEAARRVLLIEDESALARTLADMLQSQGYVVEKREDGAEGLEAASKGFFDLILLDVMLPSMDGYEVCRNLRRRGVDTPVLMLTARGEVKDKVVGFKTGADDYMAKPFDTEELQLRIDAMIRRATRAMDEDLRNYEVGGQRVDFARGRIIRGSETIALSDQESRLLQYFVENRRKVFSRDTLLKDVWGYKAVPTTRTVDVHIVWLRQKIEENPKKPRYIVTIHGQGYRFDG